MDARTQDFSFDPDFQEPRFRTRVLEAFLQLRNKILLTNPGAAAGVFPNLELQYSRLYGRQEDSPIIRGSDLTIQFPDGRVIPLSGKVGEFRHRSAMLNEGMEAHWLEHFVSKFDPNNCPRIVLP